MTLRKRYAPDDPRVIACSAARAAAGGSRAIADVLGIKRQAVDFWQIVPSERVLVVEKLTGISRFELRPDVFGEPGQYAHVDDFRHFTEIGLRGLALADTIKMPLAEIARWDKVPAELVLKVEKATGISRYQLRPDVFGPAPETVGNAA